MPRQSRKPDTPPSNNPHPTTTRKTQRDPSKASTIAGAMASTRRTWARTAGTPKRGTSTTRQLPTFKAAATICSPPSTKEEEEAEDATDATEAEDAEAAAAA